MTRFFVATACAVVAASCGDRDSPRPGPPAAASDVAPRSRPGSLEDAVRRKDWTEVRRLASALADEMESGFPGVIDALVQEERRDVQTATVEALGRVTGVARTVPDILLASKDALADGVVTENAKLLARLGESSVPMLRFALASRREDVRARAAWALGTIGAPSSAALGDLAAGLSDSSDEVRSRVAYAVESLLTAVPAAGDARLVERLGAALSDGEPRVRASAIAALGSMGPTSVSQLESMIRAAREDPAVNVRRFAATVLPRISADVRVEAALRAAATLDQSPEVRAAAKGALETLGR